jgi:CotH kinase protein
MNPPSTPVNLRICSSFPRLRIFGHFALILLATFGPGDARAEAAKADKTDVLFVDRVVPRLSIEIPPEGMQVLRQYRQVWREERPERIDVKATVREGDQVYKDVAIHLKGSFTFQPIDARPSLTLNFDKFAPGQRFHGLNKIHLNNTVQDPSCLNEAVARDFFNDIGVVTPRAGHASVILNGRPLGLYVLLEGANKEFLKRHFASAKGNFYDAGSGGEIDSELEIDSGDKESDRAELKALAEAASELDPAKRWARLNELLDVDQFLSFIAGEVLLVHWDGYATGAPNNYRVYHDVSRGKLVFIPHGLDQLLGSGAAARTLRPSFTGLVARGLVTTPEGRSRYMKRITNLAAKEFQSSALLARVDQIATKLRKGLNADPDLMSDFGERVNYIKSNLARRSETVKQLLEVPAQPVKFDAKNTATLTQWQFKSSNTRPATGMKGKIDGQEVLKVQSRGPETAGSWRSLVLLEDGRYAFTVRARTDGFDESSATGTNGLIVRKSGDKLSPGKASPKWTTLRYEFEIGGIEDVELVCEFRGNQGSGLFDPTSMRLTRLKREDAAIGAPK